MIDPGRGFAYLGSWFGLFGAGSMFETKGVRRVSRRVHVSRIRAAAARSLALFGLLGLSLGWGPDIAADPGPAPAAERSGEIQSLSLDRPAPLAPDAISPTAPDTVGCPTAVLPNNNSASPNQRAPNGNELFGRAVWLITASEMAASGLPNGTVPSAIGFRYAAAPGAAASGTLKVYLQNTTDTTNTKSTTWATAIAAMTLVHNATTVLPNVANAFDLNFSGSGISAFTYTGGGLYVAFDWSWAGPVTTAASVSCSTTLTNGLLGNQSNTSAPTTLAASNYRPETRLTPSVATIFNDGSVDAVFSPGSLPKSLVGPQTVQAVVSNRGANVINNLQVTLNVTGAQTFTDTQTVPGPIAACGGQAIVTFNPFPLTATGSDTVTVSVPADDFNGNNSRNHPLDSTFNLYSYKYPGTTATGGAGFSNGSGDLVAKFTVAKAAKVSQINLEFFSASGASYRAAVYPESSPGSGVPSTTPSYLDSADRIANVSGPVTITLPASLAVGAGAFFAGIQQINATFAGLSFDAETPIRSSAFYLGAPNPASSWLDFSPGSNFKLNVGVTLIECASAAECNDNNACTDDACTNNICVHTNNNATSCDGNPCSNPDQCVNGTCVPGPNPCNDNNACTVDLCDGQGGCSYAAVDCNDNNPCTDDFCIPATGCGHANNTAACFDGNPCAGPDACSNGACVSGPPIGTTFQVCNNAGIAIPLSGAGTPYPSAITVSGRLSYLCSMTVDLKAISHSYPSDIDILLARTSGPNAIIMSDVGGGTPVTNVNLTLSDAASASLPAGGPLVSGTFRPTNVGTGDVWPAPAPAPLGGSALSAFYGIDPNGEWDLWLDDQLTPDGGSLGGWCINLRAVCGVAADCNDNSPCTSDACTNGVCSHTGISGGTCNDNNPCTINDTCNNGTCAGTPDNSQTCSDNSLCTSPDVCQNGVCVGQNPVTCAPDSNVCTTEACNPATGACESTNNTAPCDDGNACTIGDVCGPTLSESFDGEVAPNLPGAWTSTVTGAGNPWTTDNTSSDTAPNSAFGFDGISVADEALLSPVINVRTAAAQLTFRNRWSFESGSSNYDGGVLEISIDGGSFTDIVAAGGSFVSGGYTGQIFTGFSNPLAGRNAWTATSTGYPAYLTTVVNLPASAAGFAVQLQWRIGTDSSTSAPGQNIDSIKLIDGTNVCTPGTGSPSCDDANPCTDDFCDPSVGCQHSNNVESCDDGNACTILDTCANGRCAGTTITCDDSNPCTTDNCDPSVGCQFVANTNPCDDGNACTGGDVCFNGTCSGTPITPPETQGVVAAANKTTYSWTAAASATRYDAVRGALNALPVGPGGGDETCFDNLPGTSLTDTAVPAPGAGYWYLARGESSCGNGTYGTQSNGTPRTTTTCP